MLSSLTNPNVLVGAFLLTILQVLAALPWYRSVDPKGFARLKSGEGLLGLLGVLLALWAVAAVALGYKASSASLPFYGRIYAAVLHLQLLVDLFIYGPVFLAYIWPKGGAVALAAYREGWRQPMFWLITGFGLVATWIAVILPYFTFGDDFKMMKQIGFDLIMLAAVLFGILAASISISEEIEGRTAITLMSKPINRRQFLLGKYVGILLACGGMSLILGWNLNWALIAMPEFDPINKDRAFDPMPEQAKLAFTPKIVGAMPQGPAKAMAEGIGAWSGETFANSFHILWGFGQVMILVSIATALATRLPFVVNVVLCLVVYFLGHLAPVLVRVSDKLGENNQSGAQLIRFLGNLFDTLLPALEFFNTGPAIIRETALDLWPFAIYVLTVTVYAAIYTAIALVVGLLLFEDRDLA